MSAMLDLANTWSKRCSESMLELSQHTSRAPRHTPRYRRHQGEDGKDKNTRATDIYRVSLFLVRYVLNC